MKVIGITGGVGAGKSKVLHFLEAEYGAVVCQLDHVAFMLQRKGQPCFDEIVKEFGEEVRRPDGELDRQKLAEVVFGDQQRLGRLNAIVHPLVKEWVRRDIIEKEKEHIPLYVIEAALLPEAGYEDICGEIWYIYASEDARRKRLKSSRGYSDERISRMIESQSPDEGFRKVCQAVIDNSGPFEYTKKQIGEIL
ncbi:dephospho-CoA kinase [Luxibacter massiliensis]|uniref:dephospho-CoA kinase n=1 Tax=Luxibacter massiliensis TaxID=2219695 RepID=UPI000F051D33|nr:dephospho-CoA kinase [Luxibacter massiliensis]